MGKRSLLTIIALCLCGQAFAATTGLSSMPATPPTKAPLISEGEDFDDIIGEMEKAVRKTETIQEVSVPTELPRLQMDSGLDVDLKPSQAKKWNRLVEEMEKIINLIKDLPKKLDDMKKLAARLRKIYVEGKK